MDRLPICGLELDARRVDGGLDTGCFAVTWLESRSVLTLSHVNVGIVVSAGWTSINLNVDVLVVLVWKVDVDVCTRVSTFRSAFLSNVDILSAVWKVAMLLFPCDKDLFLVVPLLSSGAGKMELGLDVSGSSLLAVALVRRWEEADRNRDASVKIQIDGC